MYLNWTTGSQPKLLILAFSDGPSVPGGMSVGMNWLTPTHLELTYKGQRPLDFQALKCRGVDISVRDLASEKPGASGVELKDGKRSLQAPPPFADQKAAKPPLAH